jgi:hypothetical protein
VLKNKLYVDAAADGNGWVLLCSTALDCARMVVLLNPSGPKQLVRRVDAAAQKNRFGHETNKHDS